MKNSIFARFARAILVFWHFVDVLVLSTTWNDLFCSCVDDVSIWWQMFNFVFLFPKRWFQFNSRMVRTHFSRIMTLNNWKIIAETRSYIFRWRSRFRRLRVCLSSLLFFWRQREFASIGSLSNHDDDGNGNVTNLHIWRRKTIVLHALHVHSLFFTFRWRSRSLYGVKRPVLQLCGRREHMMTNVQFCLVISKALIPI